MLINFWRSNETLILEKQKLTIQLFQLRVWVFPEGTRNSTDDKMLPFKKGGFHMAQQSGVGFTLKISDDLSF